MIRSTSLRTCCGVLLAAAALLLAPAGQAANVSIADVSGQPGDTVTVVLSLDDTPLDELGLFTLDLELGFDPTVLSIQAIRDGSLAGSADFYTTGLGTVPVTTSPLAINIIASYPSAPGAGTLVELDFLIAAGAAIGQSSPLALTFVDATSPSILAANVSGGAISVIEPTVVPVPVGAVWLLASALASLGGYSIRRNARAA